MSKTPFEIRADLLAMAKDYLDQQYHINTNFAREAFEKAVQVNTAAVTDWQKFVPQIYSLDELTKKAQELYSFVTTK